RVSSDGVIFSQWLGDDRFVFSLAQREHSLTLVVLYEDDAQEYTVEGVSPGLTNGLLISPDGYRMLVSMPWERTTGIADFLAGEAHPLLQPDITTHYDFFYEWLDDSTLRVTVSLSGYSPSASVIYTVRIR
ncbi:MAG: hypothetical protein KC546_07405, partial [Anaerolineae bacterium]|nr:hypothetical protein [Anaerolineae bacterium]